MASKSDKKTVDGRLVVAGREYELLSVKGREALSEIFRYEVTAEEKLPVPSVKEVVGAQAQLTIESVGASRTIVGYVERVEYFAHDNDKLTGRFVIRPRLHAQTLGRDCFAFQ